MTTRAEIHPILLAGRWVPATDAGNPFHAVEPAHRRTIDAPAYPMSSWTDLERLLEAGREAAAALASMPAERFAVFFEACADALSADAAALGELAHRETGLPLRPRLLEVELPRTLNQLRLAARAVREGHWRRPTIDTAAGLRSMHAALGGPVVVFGPSNFPFAFNAVAGGDFAAALAAGNPVIAKAHPGHPGTSARLAECARVAAERAGLPAGTVQLFFHCAPADGLRLVGDRRVGAVAFTGSRAAGLALKAAADAAGRPIYLELSSVNPVFILPGALHARGAAIAAELHASCAMGAGQFCTKPGLAALVGGEAAEAFVDALVRATRAGAPGVLLGAQAPEAIAAVVARLRGAGAELLVGGEIAAEVAGYAYAPTLLRVDAARFLASPAALQSEAFGHVSLLVVARSADELVAVAAAMEGNLTASIYSDDGAADEALHARLFALLRPRVGRLLDDRMPTGVAVSAAMNHGGPFPATGHPGFTAVGLPASIHRFTALHCYDHVRPHRLPPELQDRNPDGRLLRLVDGEWTTRDV